MFLCPEIVVPLQRENYISRVHIDILKITKKIIVYSFKNLFCSIYNNIIIIIIKAK